MAREWPEVASHVRGYEGERERKPGRLLKEEGAGKERMVGQRQGHAEQVIGQYKGGRFATLVRARVKALGPAGWVEKWPVACGGLASHVRRRRVMAGARLRYGVPGRDGAGTDGIRCAVMWDTGRGAWATQETTRRSERLPAARHGGALVRRSSRGCA